jgi:predicted transglutaminase-like cysteine proteinase
MAVGGNAWRGLIVAVAAFAALAIPAHLAAESIKLASLTSATQPLFGDQAAPTVGAALMCGRDLPNEEFCAGVRQYRPLVLDQATLDKIASVNHAVNVEIEPVDDMVEWHVPEKWNRPVRGADGRLQDDCDGYVIEKWYRLVVEGGLPTEAFYPLYAEVPGLGGHLVLAVITTSGTLLLDNLHENLVPMKQFNFTYLKRPRAGTRLDGNWERYLAWGSGSDATGSDLSAAH